MTLMMLKYGQQGIMVNATPTAQVSGHRMVRRFVSAIPPASTTGTTTSVTTIYLMLILLRML